MNVSVRSRLTKAAAAFLLIGIPSALPAQTDNSIDPAALQQIRELLQEKQSRTSAQRKLGTQLVYAARAAAGLRLTASIDALPEAAAIATAAGVVIDVKAATSSALLPLIAQAGGRMLYTSPRTGNLRARIPLQLAESLAGQPGVQFIRPGARPRAHRVISPLSAASLLGRMLPGPPMLNFLTNRLGLGFFAGSLTSQGDVSHGAKSARTTYGINGSGVRVGVLSDSAEALAFLIGTGDLPAGTMIVDDLIGGPGSSEGTAMMEIVNDLAPGAQLFFASAFNGPESFADNIRALRDVYRCDIIVDDVSYSDEFPFQDGTIAQAVNDVTASGAMYFSSAGNGGNITSGTSSVWEGDFSSAGTTPSLPGYTLHKFGAQPFNRAPTGAGVVDLFWSDPVGGSGNDYDLFILNPAGTAVLAASLDTQNGTQDPIEEVFSPTGFPANSRIVVAAFGAAAPRALHVGLFFGERLQLATNAVTRGHNAGPSTVSVAAVYWNSARTGTRPFVGGAANPTEVFSSDGPRKMFFNANGTAITPGNFLFGANGGFSFIKPDIAAADGVTTRTPGFNPFFGTSAAAPHAAGVAALVKSARPSRTAAKIKSAMTSTALDIRAVGIDRDSGYGIVTVPPAVDAILR